jgi:predicted Mrr-cat superfamily restriction endonuclease
MATMPSSSATPTTQPTILQKVFVIRAERKGEDEDFNFSHHVTSIHWNEFPDPFTNTREDLEQYAAGYPYGKDSPCPGAPRQIWQFAHDDDLDSALIVTPRLDPQHHGEVAVGWCHGPAKHIAVTQDSEPNLQRPVTWVATNLPRSAFSEAAQSRLKHRLTVSRIRNPEVVRNILAVLASYSPQEDHPYLTPADSPLSA